MKEHAFDLHVESNLTGLSLAAFAGQPKAREPAAKGAAKAVGK
jgi:hypothetical protein